MRIVGVNGHPEVHVVKLLIDSSAVRHIHTPDTSSRRTLSCRTSTSDIAVVPCCEHPGIPRTIEASQPERRQKPRIQESVDLISSQLMGTLDSGAVCRVFCITMFIQPNRRRNSCESSQPNIPPQLYTYQVHPDPARRYVEVLSSTIP